MKVPLWVAERAAEFWADAGALEPFPRQLRRPIARALPVTVVYLPRLRLEDVRTWLHRNAVVCPCVSADRPLRACLVARGGNGFIFIDGCDPEDEQRFSLAHELAHFLRDYRHPGRRAAARIGERVREVFDGQRPATTSERLGAVLAQVPIGFHVHLMERDGGGQPTQAAVALLEEDADRLALELLAPAETVQAELTAGAEARDASALARWLQARFGLPAALALAYAALWLPRASDPWLRRLGGRP